MGQRIEGYGDLRALSLAEDGGDGGAEEETAVPDVAKGSRRRFFVLGAGLVAGGLTAVWCLAWPGHGGELAAREASLAVEAFEEHADSAFFRCGRIEHDTEYMGEHIKYIEHVPSPEHCCARCQQNPKCRTWVWGSWEGDKRHYQLCTLRTLDYTVQRINKVHRRGVVSGAPFTWDAPHSLYCFTVVKPGTYELDLMQLQVRNSWGIFGCDEYEVVSNMSMTFAPGISAVPIASSLQAEKGGEFDTSLNTNIFITAWNKVVENGRWRFNTWTVKADPDTVFFPQRLRVAVAFHPDSFNGAYLNNCKLGLHGPIEVLSSRAVQKWHEGIGNCQHYFNNLCNGPCRWGEDMFLDQCLMKVLHVRRIDDFNLLSEAHCGSKDWKECDNYKVAFHPFKTHKDYSACVKRAQEGGLPTIERV